MEILLCERVIDLRNSFFISSIVLWRQSYNDIKTVNLC